MNIFHRKKSQLSFPVRILAAIAGVLLAIVNIPLLVVLPEVGVPLLLVALHLLGYQFAWARRANKWVAAKWQLAKTWLRKKGLIGMPKKPSK